ncbi:MAG: hypothetical protein GY732_02180 [Gammaproteobacteria bacterium]|nr:hypothetical protein [Gammaproteobacteria bacterium]
MAPRYQEILAPEASVNVEEVLNELGKDSIFVLKIITHGGMACGPVWHTNIVAIDYAPERTQELEVREHAV